MSKKTEKCRKALKGLSIVKKYLTDAGFINHADKIHNIMCNIDGELEDQLNDSIISSVPDVQMNYPGSGEYTQTGEVAGGMQGAFNIVAPTIASLANRLDKIGMYEEADELDDVLNMMSDDDMLEIIEDLVSYFG